MTVCKKCYVRFNIKTKFDSHLDGCLKNETVKVSFPPEKCVSFKKYKNKVKIPFIIYADFESILLKHKLTEEEKGKNT